MNLLRRLAAPELRERFWNLVDIRGPDDCWTSKHGGNKDYAVFWIDSNCELAAHVVAYLMVYGPIPLGYHVLHSCDNPPCRNPAHLWAGTRKDNMADMVAKGRHSKFFLEKNPALCCPDRRAKGAENGNAKLTDSKVKLLRKLSANGLSQRAIAKELMIGQTTVGSVLRGTTWKHIGVIKSF